MWIDIPVGMYVLAWVMPVSCTNDLTFEEFCVVLRLCSIIILLMYWACKDFVFSTLAMYRGKRGNIREVPFGYDEIQQNCHQFCSELSFKKCVLIFRKSLSNYLPRRPLCVCVSEFQYKPRESWTQIQAGRSTSRRPAATAGIIYWDFIASPIHLTLLSIEK